ncbi:MFS transporter [Enterococcus sp. AZ103]|uniref:MFS transporter n=1 Tax=Enterococcus sp. AZ103 TaxID=2774628 RepID=UPI003F26CA66
MQAKPKTFALVIFILGVFMSALDNGIISSALTTIEYSFNISAVQGTWGITLYTLGMAIATPIIGKLADKFGRKKLFLIEISIFALGSLLVALSPSFIFFLAARLLQSFGGGGIFIIASSHILSTYSKEKQGALLGALGAINGIASVVGPNLGSLVLNVTGHWSWLFLINLPIAVFVIIAGLIAIPETKQSHTQQLDIRGLTLLTFGILSFMLAITNLQSGALLASLLTVKVLGLFALGIVFFGAFVWAEKNIKVKTDPFLPYSLLKSQGFLLTLLMGLLSGTLIAIFVFIPSFVEQTFGISANNSGIFMSGIGLGSIVGAGLGGMLVSKLGATRTITLSGIISTIGFGLIAFFGISTILFIAASSVAGLGFGMLMGAPFSVLINQIAGAKDSGVALGTLSVSRQIGLTIAPTLYATIVQNGFSEFAKSVGGSHLSVEALYLKLQKLGDTVQINLFHQTAQSAYQGLFLLAVAASLIILAGGFYLNRKKI